MDTEIPNDHKIYKKTALDIPNGHEIQQNYPSQAFENLPKLAFFV
jgi:hypothetical protein